MGEVLVKPWALLNTDSPMWVACGNKWITLCCPLLIIISIFYWSAARGTSSEVQFQDPLENKNVLVLHALESTASFFKIKHRALSATLESGGISTRKQFYEFIGPAAQPRH
jgi:hypothetical protein